MQSGQQTKNSFYVFNLGNNQGFVIVSGDDRTEEILGYSESGSYDEDNMPENMRQWLQGYDREIRAIPADWQPVINRRATEQTRSMIMPMSQTKWDQGRPYWNLTPMVLSYPYSCYTGCAATVLAQAMYYYKWPQAETAEIPSYYSSKSGSTTVGNLDALPPVKFDWANMLPTYYYDNITDSYNYTDEQATAVATLMQYAGHAVKMNYGTGSSGASPNALAPALIKYFDYARSTRLLSRCYYTISDWDNMVYGELVAGRPVIYDGFTCSDGGGHVFLVDGYDGDGFYHVNWGWNGKNDGFFRLSVMNPYDTSGSGSSSSKYGYAYDQDAIFGLQPSTAYSGDDLSSMEYLYSFYHDGTTIKEKMRNMSGDTKEFEMGFGCFDDEGNLRVIYSEYVGELSPGQYTSQIQKNIDGLFSDGSYTIYAINRVFGTSQWHVFTNYNYAQIVTVSGGVTTINDAYDYSDVSMEVKGWELIGNHKQDSHHELKVTIKNNGSDYENELFLYGTYDDVTYSQLTKAVVALAEGETGEVTFFFTPNQAGTLKLFVARDYYGSDDTNNLLTNGEKSFTITPFSYEVIGDKAKLTATALTIDGINVVDGRNEVFGHNIIGHITIKNTADTEFKGQAPMACFMPMHFEYEDEETHEIKIEDNGTENMIGNVGRDIPYIELAAGEEKTYDFTIYGNYFGEYEYYRVLTPPIPDAVPHRICLTNDYWDDVKEEMVHDILGEEITIYPIYGVTINHADGSSSMVSYKQPIVVPATATSVDLRGFSGDDVVLNTASAQPNCLYLRYGTEGDITGLPTVNVIEGTTAEKIVLTDGYDFVPPFDFTAENISYTRTPSLTTNGTGGWQTLVLPFAATKLVRTDTGAQLNWFQSATESGKQLWIKDFVSVDGSNVQFDYAPTTLEAYHPYIIAVPGNRWGASWDMTGVPLRFEGNNAAIMADARSNVSASSWNYTGTTASMAATDVYAINVDGTGFAKTSSSMNPFTAWFVNKTVSAPAMLRIVQVDNSTTGIRATPNPSLNGGEWYDLQGRKLVNSSQLKKGIYMVNGHKVIIK